MPTEKTAKVVGGSLDFTKEPPHVLQPNHTKPKQKEKNEKPSIIAPTPSK